jgi:sensor histidine kinase YesM
MESISFVEFLRNRIDDFAYMFLSSLGFISAYYWLYTKLEGKIRLILLRRNVVGLILLAVYSVYYFTLLYGKIYHQLAGNSEKIEPYLQAYFSMIISSIVFFNLYYIFTFKFAKNENRLVQVVKSVIFFLLVIVAMVGTNWPVYKSDFLQLIPFYAIVAIMVIIIDLGCRYIIRLQSMEKQVKEMETLRLREQLIQAQLDALHAKTNPHFLYNSLNSIAGLALIDGQKTRNMAISLSKFFRYSINRENSNLTTIKEEMEMVETYLEIEKVRFEERLNYEIIIDPGLEKNKIPRFILQPIVENSIIHGSKGDINELFIIITARNEGKKVSLSVQDNGLQFSENFVPGYGFKSVYDKLDLLFHGKYEVSIYNSPAKQVSIIIET